MVGTGGYRSNWCEGVGGGSSGQGRGDGRRRDEAVGDDGQQLKTGDIT